MNERIKEITQKTLNGQMWIETVKTEYDRTDLFLNPVTMSAKRVSEYILNQEPYIDESTALTGYIRFDGSVEGDIFTRSGHKNFWIEYQNFYAKPVEGFATFEWQHSVADFDKVIKKGIKGYKNEIKNSLEKYKNDTEKTEFLLAVYKIADAIAGWANKCSLKAAEKASSESRPDVKSRLMKMAQCLKNVPENPAKSFYEAIQTIYLIYAFDPDSIGLIDRYLYSFYKNDILSGALTKDEAKAYLQELFLMLQWKLNINDTKFTRGGESHFAIGGYLPNGEDGFNELSYLIVEALMELPTYIPQISLRWTKKTPKEVLRYMMDCERKDTNKRIAFVSDEPRIKAFMDIAGFDYETACAYTMVGCNEPQLPGGIFMGGCDTNILKPIESMMYDRRKDICNASDFDELYGIYEQEMHKWLDKAIMYHDRFQKMRERDTNIVSTMFFEGSIEQAKSATQGGSSRTVAAINIFGITNVIDSLSVIKQFVYDEKLISMEELADALENNWEGYEDLRQIILKRAHFFGNDNSLSDGIADRFTKSLYEYMKDKKSSYGQNYLFGNLIGYNEHNKWFGEKTKATPDGRCAGEPISFGVGQTDGKDREGLSALLNSVAKFDPYGMTRGATVTNVLLDEQLIKNDDNFEKMVDIFETYFKNGGMHFQLTYVSKEDLKKAKIAPEKYKSLRVRVSGFSDYFVRLNDALQDDIIKRTEIVR